METLFGKTLTQLKEVVSTLGLKPFVDKQIASWLYQKGITSIDEMTNLTLESRQKLQEYYWQCCF
ncbi:MULTISPECIES: hypothetical protein [unclassified Oceanispirochaeta]|uniref:hypothetical protein n=1 Tax=unclassified Oceanispirochaeta TaxID=2635722 RepID=UPI000E099E6A|nr:MULTISPECIES: hypothetical protein [unclassified Oceanispirochaeta]MBF9018290.1 hypothetical protein [Oceanispirochaeta sp. M2]NPD74755.1 hypothetical protein [Oceanispirochaeta sp. M1]RDG29369.1 hypothetical protein DV872_21880 [Oceanispirochaeta sp. M1]